jgi:hypothetical protein
MTEGFIAEIEYDRDRAIEGRSEAWHAALNYWEAWQDAAVYWKDRVHQLESDLLAARNLSNEYYWDIRQLVSDYQWEKHWASDREDHSWLNEVYNAS